MRTPLHILCAMADDLQTLPDSQHQGVHNDLILLKSSAHWLLAHANNVLDVCAGGAGGARGAGAVQHAQPRAVDVGGGAVRGAGVRAFTSRPTVTIPPLVVGDGPRLQQVLRVLLSFIFQHVTSGAVLLDVRPAGNSTVTRPAPLSMQQHPVPIGSRPARRGSSRSASPVHVCELQFSLSASLPSDWWRLDDQAGSSGTVFCLSACLSVELSDWLCVMARRSVCG